MIKLFVLTYLSSICSKAWATSCVEPDTICVSDDRPKTHMAQYLKGMVPKAKRGYIRLVSIRLFGYVLKRQ